MRYILTFLSQYYNFKQRLYSFIIATVLVFVFFYPLTYNITLVILIREGKDIHFCFNYFNVLRLNENFRHSIKLNR